MKLFSYDCLPSTNGTAKEIIKSDPSQTSFAVFANEQTAGKGQHGNSWTSPVGGLYLSLALHDAELDTTSPLAIDTKRQQIAIQIRDTLKNLCKANTPFCIKWPNDFYTIDGKLGGILCETISTCSDWLIVGIGINVLRENDDTGSVIPAVIPAQAGKAGIHFSETEGNNSISYLEDYTEQDTVISVAEITKRLLGSLRPG